VNDDHRTRIQNLTDWAELREWQAKDFEQAVGGRDTYWHGVLAGSRPYAEKAARKFEEAVGLPRGTLDVPGAFKRGRKPEVNEITAPYVVERKGDVVIPQYQTGGKMGDGLILRDQPGVIHSWHVTQEWVQKNVRNATAATNLCIVTGFGDSMRPLYNPGDPLIVDRGVTKVEFDAIYFFRVEHEGYIKRLQRIPRIGGGVLLRAKSENKSYDPFDIDPSMDFEVFGRVLKLWKGEDY
jgi:hypothetical protein